MSGRRAAWFIGIAGVLIFSGALNHVLDVLFHPWALAEPPLLDSWAGRLTTGNGVPLVVGMELRRAGLDSRTGRACAKCDQVEGTAATCDPRGGMRRYRVSGSPRDRHARAIVLGVVPERQPPPEGLEMAVMRGSWDGADTLVLEAEFFWRRDGAAVSSTDDPATKPVPLRMERVDAERLAALCTNR